MLIGTGEGNVIMGCTVMPVVEMDQMLTFVGHHNFGFCYGIAIPQLNSPFKLEELILEKFRFFYVSIPHLM